MRNIISFLIVYFFCLQEVWGNPFSQICPGSGVLCQQTPNVPKCNYTPPLDGTFGAIGAYSFRILSSNWIGRNIVKIQRSSDNTTKIFTASAPSCTINTSDSFFDSSTYTIVTWYDQSNSGSDLTQNVTNRQATVTLSCLNSEPCAVFSGASLAGYSVTLGNSVGADTFAAVASYGSSTTNDYIVFIGSAPDNTALTYQNSTNSCAADRVTLNSVDHHYATSSCSLNTFYSIVSSQNNNSGKIYVNGTLGNSSNASLNLVSSTNMAIGKATFNSNQWTGDLAELMIFSPDISSAISANISTNQMTFWGIP